MIPFSKVQLTKTKQIRRMLLFAFVLLLVTSCKKDPPTSYCSENPGACVDVRDVKDYFYFKIGSYWVYEEETSGERDSVYVIETASDPTSVLFGTTKYSTYDGYDYRYWTKGVSSSVKNNVARKSEKTTRVVSAKFKSGDYVAEATCFLFYPVTGLWTYSYGGTGIVENVLIVDTVYNNLSIEDMTFNDVVCIKEEHTVIEESQPTVHYYSPKIGLVKKELLTDNEVWNLVKYHIQE